MKKVDSKLVFDTQYQLALGKDEDKLTSGGEGSYDVQEIQHLRAQIESNKKITCSWSLVDPDFAILGQSLGRKFMKK